MSVLQAPRSNFEANDLIYALDVNCIGTDNRRTANGAEPRVIVDRGIRSVTSPDIVGAVETERAERVLGVAKYSLRITEPYHEV